MAQLHKLELQTQITSSPDKLFDIYKNKTYLVPNISPDKLQSIHVLEGDGKSVGSVRLWTYVAVDEENKSISFELISGEVTEYFKSFKATIEDDLNTVKWSLEYEKASEDVPNPHSHLECLVNMSREIDAYLLKAWE